MKAPILALDGVRASYLAGLGAAGTPHTRKVPSPLTRRLLRNLDQQKRNIYMYIYMYIYIYLYIYTHRIRMKPCEASSKLCEVPLESCRPSPTKPYKALNRELYRYFCKNTQSTIGMASSWSWDWWCSCSFASSFSKREARWRCGVLPLSATAVCLELAGSWSLVTGLQVLGYRTSDPDTGHEHSVLMLFVLRASCYVLR